MRSRFQYSRRRFLVQSAVAGGAALTGMPGILRAQTAPGIISSDALRPVAAQGLQIGDAIADRAIVWSRSDRPARMMVEWSLREDFRDSVTVPGPHAIETTDYTARVDLT